MANNTDIVLYILGDVDRVREHIDRRLLAGNLEAVKSFSAALTRGLHDLARAIEEPMVAETIMAGGDDVLFRLGLYNYSRELLIRISETFQKQTGCT